MHPWIGAGDDDRRRILAELGLGSVDQLFASIPSEVCVDRLPIPDARGEEAVRDELIAMALANLSPECAPSFLGAGVYPTQITLAEAERVRYDALDDMLGTVLSRAEFFTSYTPYQPEITQGTLQVIFEFQTLICELTGMEVANASLYDGATALVEAVLFAHRVGRGTADRVVLAETVHPMYRRVVETYADPAGLEVVVVPPGDDCIAVQSPNFLGIVEDLPAVAAAAHDAGALAVQVVTEAVSLGLLAGGGAFGFDVVCGEAQSFGVAPGFGGPHLGIFTCREKHVRQMPGRLVGGRGLHELATACLSRSEDLKRRISDAGGGWRLAYPSSPTFNEFLITGPGAGDELARRLAGEGVLAGVPARAWGGSWPDGLLVAAGERTTRSDADALAAALARVS